MKNLVMKAWVVAAMIWSYGFALIGFDFVYLCFGLIILAMLFVEGTK